MSYETSPKKPRVQVVGTTEEELAASMAAAAREQLTERNARIKTLEKVIADRELIRERWRIAGTAVFFKLKELKEKDKAAESKKAKRPRTFFPSSPAEIQKSVFDRAQQPPASLPLRNTKN